MANVVWPPLAPMALPCDGRRWLVADGGRMMVYVGWLKLRTTLSSEGAPMWWQTHSDGGRMRWYMWTDSNHILPLALMALPCDGRRVLA